MRPGSCRTCISGWLLPLSPLLLLTLSSRDSQFWRIKASDDVRAILKTELPHVRENKIKRFTKYLRKLEAANAQHYLAFDYVLNIAYGRKGKLKRELMEVRLFSLLYFVVQRISSLF